MARTALLVDDVLRARRGHLRDRRHLPALEAALAEIDGSGADLIVVGGDVAWGPLPRGDGRAAGCPRLEGLLRRGDADRDALESLSGAVLATLS